MLVSDEFVLQHALNSHVCTTRTEIGQTITVFRASTLTHDSVWPSQDSHAIPKSHTLPFNQSHLQSRIPAC